MTVCINLGGSHEILRLPSEPLRKWDSMKRLFYRIDMVVRSVLWTILKLLK